MNDDIKSMASDGYIEKVTKEMIIEWLNKNIE